MIQRKGFQLAVILLCLLFSPPPSEGGLSKDLAAELAAAKYVYIASTRKDGALGKPSEIWFFSDGEAVYVGTSPKSWRVRRIKAGRPQAKIWIGKPDGASHFNATEGDLEGLPSFAARGEIVNDAKMQEKMFEAYAKKYKAGWSQHESGFRDGFKDGSRVMLKYTPVE
jgi:hypothetical protein